MATEETIEVRSSRWWALFHFQFTRLVFPARLIADQLGISTHRIDKWYKPWARSDEHLPMTHLAEVMHDRGLFWDSVGVESSGGANPLTIDGVPKSAARRFVEYVRVRMNEAPSSAAPSRI
jgi:hypothetical protein